MSSKLPITFGHTEKGTDTRESFPKSFLAIQIDWPTTTKCTADAVNPGTTDTEWPKSRAPTRKLNISTNSRPRKLIFLWMIEG